MAPRKTALITDLDNTLFDWVELWLNTFSPMLDEIVAVSGVSKDTLIPEIKAVHQRHGTSEYSFLIEEVPSLQAVLKGRPATDVFAGAIEIYRNQRRKFLTLYPTVAETLLKIRGRGTLVVGYTESMAFYSNYRIRRLGLDGVFDYIFCPEDHVLPAGLSPEALRKYPARHYELNYTKSHFTPKGSKKPAVDVLNAIINDLGLNKTSCVYVGDSLMKDVAMALDCGVDGVWAKYGQAHKRPEYKLLQDVTHWTDEEVQREQKIKEREDVTPTHTLADNFSELTSHFDFGDFYRKPPLTSERRTEVIDIWKAVIEVQRHFNEISMRIRGFFVTIVLAIFAAVGFLMGKEFGITAGPVHIEFLTFIPLIGIFASYLVYFMDRYWYHRLLTGAVNHAVKIEKAHRDDIPELNLSEAIGVASAYTPQRPWSWLPWLVVRHEDFRKQGKLRSDAKIELFYKSVIWVLAGVAVLLAVTGGVKFDTNAVEPPTSQTIDGEPSPTLGAEPPATEDAGAETAQPQVPLAPSESDASAETE